MVARFVRDEEAVGSNPASPTRIIKGLRRFSADIRGSNSREIWLSLHRLAWTPNEPVDAVPGELNFAHEIEHNQNHKDEAQAAVQTVTDAVTFGGNASDQNQQQDDEEDGGESHDW